MKYTILFSMALLAAISHAQTKTSTDRPEDRAHHSGVYDPLLNGFVIYGGFIFLQGKPQPTDDLWAWNGREWKEIAQTGRSRIITPMAFDNKRQRLLAFGGSDQIQIHY